MKRIDKRSREWEGKSYQVFKNYPINTKKKKVNTELHYIVPWEMMDEENKPNFI